MTTRIFKVLADGLMQASGTPADSVMGLTNATKETTAPGVKHCCRKKGIDNGSTLLFLVLAAMTLLIAGCSSGGLEVGGGNQIGESKALAKTDSFVKPSDEELRRKLPINENAAMRKTETAILAGGCFWGMEELLRKIDGVIDTEVGYCGGRNENATYQFHPGHAEAVRVVFDPAKISFKKLLTDWFFRMHDPTTLNRQGNDRGTSYRSTIFYADDEQKNVALEAIKEAAASGRWKDPIVTTVEPVKNWSVGEGYHQDYLVKNPGGYTCHWLRP